MSDANVQLQIHHCFGPAYSFILCIHDRYAFTDYVECVLENDQGLVATPFVKTITSSSRSRSSDASAANEVMDFQEHAVQSQTSKSLSPPMGMNSWNFFHANIDENEVGTQATHVNDA